MDSFVLFYLVALFLIITIPIGMSLLIYWIIKRLRLHKGLRLIALTPILVVSYIIYNAFYPNDSFYEEEFKDVTGVDFPEHGDIQSKWASYPDHHGDYGSIAVIEVDPTFHENLKEQLREKGLKENDEDSGAPDLREVSDEIGDRKIETEFSATARLGLYYYVGFLSDKKTLIVNRVRW